MVTSLFKIFLISLSLLFSKIAYGKYTSFLDAKSKLILSKHIDKKILIGNANYSILFWNVYDAELYSSSKKLNSRELAIILKYNRSIDKDTLVKETIDDIKQQQNISKQKEQSWKSLLESIYVNTEINKKFIAIKINDKSFFYYDNKKIYESDDQEFNELFFNIWQRTDSKNPEFTKSLLGQ